MRRQYLSLAILGTIAATPVSAADLIEIYEMARASDPQLAAAEANMMAAGEGIVQARAALLPNISGRATLNDSSDASSSNGFFRQPDDTVVFGRSDSSGESTTRNYSLSLSQSIYDHSDYTRLRGARAGAARATASYDAAVDGLVIRVAEAYFAALTASTNLDAAQAEEKAVKRQLEQAEQRFEVGLSAITDVHEAQARFDGARAAAILAQNQLDDAYEALTELTGRPIDSVDPLVENIALDRPDPDRMEDWVSTAEAESASLAIRRFELEQAERAIETANAAHYPTLGVQYSWTSGDRWGSSTTNGLESPGDSSFRDRGFVFTLNVPIFEGLATQSRVRQETFNRDAAADSYEQEKRAIVRQTRSAYRSVIAGISEVEARRQAQVSAQSALDATQAGFEVGTRTIVDVLVSQQLLFQAQRDYARARHDYLVNTLRLKRAAGTVAAADLQRVNALLK